MKWLFYIVMAYCVLLKFDQITLTEKLDSKTRLVEYLEDERKRLAAREPQVIKVPEIVKMQEPCPEPSCEPQPCELCECEPCKTWYELCILE
jgi:hypothetical protein